MEIIETSIFTRRIPEFYSDDEYRELQAEIIAHPDIGKVIPGSGGIRKMRWHKKGIGKRGGLRILYYWFIQPKKILMLFAYQKNKQEDISKDQLKTLRKIIEEEYQ
jgi:hypothetical protein